MISKFSMRCPLNASLVTFSLPYWSWLVERNFLVKSLIFRDKNDIDNLNALLRNLNQSKINRIATSHQESNSSTVIINNFGKQTFLQKSLKILNCVDAIYFYSSCRSISLGVEMCKSLSLVCTNLKSILIQGFNINDYILSSILFGSNCLSNVTLQQCQNITGMNVLPSLLKNITELKILDCTSLRVDGWNMMLMGLTNLTSLTFHSIFSVSMLRNTLLNIVQLKYLSFSLISEEMDDLSGLIFPQNLKVLEASYTSFEMQKIQVQTLFSNSLPDKLEYLSIKSKCQFQLFVSVPPLPQGLVSLDLSQCSIKFSNNVTKETIAKLILPSNLKELNLSYSEDLDDYSIKAMMSNNNLSDLIKLDISVSPNVINYKLFN
eukprot:gene13022-17454_t